MKIIASVAANPSRKRLLTTAALVFAGAFVISGCASTVQYDAEARSPERLEVNRDRMNAINRAARNSGVEVHWVNPPKRRVKSEPTEG